MRGQRHTMQMRLLATAALAALSISLGAPSFAQTSSSNAESSSGAVSGSTSASSSRATGNRATQTQQQGVASTTNTSTGVTLNQTSNTPGSTTANNTANNTDRLTGGTTNSNNNSGYTSSDNIVRTTPTVYAPPVSGGNPCTLAISGGVSVIGWGAAAGGTFVDQDCANRQKIAMVWNSGLKDIAFELMCNDRDTYNAAKMSAASPKCSFRPQFEAPGAAPMVQQPPVPIAPMPVMATPKEYPRCDPRRGIVDNCRS